MPEELARLSRDGMIARLAAGQHGVLSSQQLGSCGLSSSAITERVAAGRLHRIHRGVYAVGHPSLSERARWMAAVLACGDAAVLSHLSAAELWGIRRQPRGVAAVAGRPESGPVDVTVPTDGGRAQRRGVRVHRSVTLATADCTRRDGIPVTKPTRTLADIRPLLSPAQFNTAVRETEFLGLPLDGGISVGRTRSELESRFLALIRRHRLPRPEVNVRLDRFVVDFFWRPQHLIAELDGWISHRTRTAFEQDRARDARLKVLGYGVVRVTWRQIEEDAPTVIETIRQLLRTPAAPRT